MRTAKTSLPLAAILFGLTVLAIPVAKTADAPKTTVADIYDESADGAQQIADALKIAKRENKRVLLKFGANWCIWCHRLHDLMERDKAISAELQAHYVVVLIDVNKGHNGPTNDKYGHPTSHGLPVLVVLDADGKQLTTKDTGELEEGDHHSPQKVLAFLQEWAPKD